MNVYSRDRFITSAFSISAALMGRTLSFRHGGARVTIELPCLDDVDDTRSEGARAVKGMWNRETGEIIEYSIRSVDVCTEIESKLEVPNEILSRPINAYQLLSDEKQAELTKVAESCLARSKSAFEYWISLLRWVSNYHKLCRQSRVGSSSGWGTYLIDSTSQREFWVHHQPIVIAGYRSITEDIWTKVSQLASAGHEPPVYSMLLSDALACIDENDFRRALVDLSVACEVFLRSRVIDSLPAGSSNQIIRLIEEVNVNQLITHLFPALLDQAAADRYKKTVKENLSSMFASRNKLMHVAEFGGATSEKCRLYSKAVRELFKFSPDPLLGEFASIPHEAVTVVIQRPIKRPPQEP